MMSNSFRISVHLRPIHRSDIAKRLPNRDLTAGVVFREVEMEAHQIFRRWEPRVMQFCCTRTLRFDCFQFVNPTRVCCPQEDRQQNRLLTTTRQCRPFKTAVIGFAGAEVGLAENFALKDGSQLFAATRNFPRNFRAQGRPQDHTNIVPCPFRCASKLRSEDSNLNSERRSQHDNLRTSNGRGDVRGVHDGGMFDLEKQFSFYGAYHNNKVNIFIHILFVWPIFFTSLIPWAYIPPLAPLPLAACTLPLQEYMVLNFGLVQAALYGLYYVALDKKAGFLGALICMGCWVGANAVAQTLPWFLSWKIVLASQVTCWFFQVFGHQKFEGRAPALLDNLPQALLMAPFFVLLECLQAFGYEPYPGFQKKVQKNVDDAIREFNASKGKKEA